MKVLFVAALAALVCTAPLGAKQLPGTRVSVEFVQPERFSDVQESGYTSGSSRDRLLSDLRDWLVREAPRYLPDGAWLTLRVTDVDDAGRIRIIRGREIRVVSEMFPARVDFTWSLRDARGNPLKSGSERLVEIPHSSLIRTDSYGPMGSVKIAVERWLRDLNRLVGSPRS